MTDDAVIKWHEEGAQQGFAFMLLVEDLETGAVSPEFYFDEDDPQDLVRDYEREEAIRRERVHACYSLRIPIEDQLSSDSPWHFEC